MANRDIIECYDGNGYYFELVDSIDIPVAIGGIEWKSPDSSVPLEASAEVYAENDPELWEVYAENDPESWEVYAENDPELWEDRQLSLFDD